MKKSILAFVLVMSCMLFMTACSDSKNVMEEEVQEEPSKEDAPSEDTPSQDNDSEENTTADDAPEQNASDGYTGETKTEAESTKTPAWNTAITLSDDLYDFQVSIDGTVYQFPMFYSDFEALGWEYEGDNTKTLSGSQYADLQRWEKDGISVYTILGNLSLETVAFSDSMVAGIRISKYDFDGCGWEILLPAGIQWGVSTIDDIKAAYGEPVSDYDSSTFYKMTYHYDYYREIELYVYKDSGVLEEIKIENLVELERNSDKVVS